MASPGDTVYPTAAQLRSIGTYCQSAGLVLVDGHAPDYDDPDREIPFLASADISMTITDESAYELGLTVKDHTMEIRVPGVDQTKVDDDAVLDWAGLNLIVQRNLGIYGPDDAHTHADWVGSGNVSFVNGNGLFTVSGKGALTLTLACDYDTRQSAVPLYLAPAGPPACYIYRKANVHYPEYGVNEARYCWLGYEALGIPLVAPGETTLVVTVVYREYPAVSDNHLTDSTRTTEFTNVGETHAVTYNLQVAAGTAVNCLCLITPTEGDYPLLERVVSISIAFAADDAGDWFIGEPLLAPDEYVQPTQERIKTFEGVPASESPSQTYTHGGLSAHIDAAFEVYDSQEGNAGHDNGAEKTVRNFDYVEGAESGLDLTTAWSLEAFASLIENCSEVFGCTVNDVAYDAATLDTEDPPNRLSTCWAFNVCYPDCDGPDIDPLEQQVGDGFARCSLRGWKWTIERGITYAIRTDKVVDGRAHGRALTGVELLRTSLGFSKIYRRFPPTGDWEEHSDVDADAYGHWDSDSLRVSPPNETPGSFWEYKVGEREIGWVWVREYVAEDASGSHPVWLMVDPFGFWYRAVCVGELVRVDRRGGANQRWMNGIWFILGDEETADPWIDKLDSELVCCWRDASGYRRITSLDDGATTTGEATTLASGETMYVSHVFGGVHYIVSAAEGQLFLRRYVAKSGTALYFEDGTTRKLICSGDFAGFWVDRGDLIVQVSDAKTWVSYDGGESWVDRTTG
jgi:hypothetical protein